MFEAQEKKRSEAIGKAPYHQRVTDADLSTQRSVRCEAPNALRTRHVVTRRDPSRQT